MLDSLLPLYYLVILAISPTQVDGYNIKLTTGKTYAVVNELTEEHVIYYNPRYAIQVRFENKCKEKPRFCIVTPRDVLVHELLHVRYMTSSEDQITEKEQKLYRELTKSDSTPRPYRGSYGVGKGLIVSCDTCVK